MDLTLKKTPMAPLSLINSSIAVNNSNSNMQCGPTIVPQSQQGVVCVGNAVITGGNNSCSNVAGATGSSSNSVTGQPNGASNTKVGIQSQPGLVQPVSVLLADRYLLLDIIDGRHGRSLYRCIDIWSHDELVCKVVNNPCTNLLVAHFRLDGHSYVNPLRKVIEGQNQTFLFFSPSKGNLYSYIQAQQRLREPEARLLFRQMCEVVKCCHEQGIVLRDLRLKKFIFADTKKSHLRLESLEDSVVLNNPAEDLIQEKNGCPAYVSPEILKVNTTYSGKAADMWSLGVILYTMLIGTYPFNDSQYTPLFTKIFCGTFTIPEWVTYNARCIIRSLLRHDPNERLTSKDIFFHPWMTRDETNDFIKSSTDQYVPYSNFDNA